MQNKRNFEQNKMLLESADLDDAVNIQLEINDSLINVMLEIDHINKLLQKNNKTLQEKFNDTSNGIINDGVEKKQTPESIRSNQIKTINTIVNNYDHEIRQPLTMIYNYAQILEEKSGTDDPNRRMYEMLLKEAKRLVGLVKKGLDLFNNNDSS